MSFPESIYLEGTLIKNNLYLQESENILLSSFSPGPLHRKKIRDKNIFGKKIQRTSFELRIDETHVRALVQVFLLGSLLYNHLFTLYNIVALHIILKTFLLQIANNLKTVKKRLEGFIGHKKAEI